MKYRPGITVKRGRVFVAVHENSLNLPRLHFYPDGDDCLTIGASYGNGNSDPLLMVDVDLSGTGLARGVIAAYWWLRNRGWEHRRCRDCQRVISANRDSEEAISGLCLRCLFGPLPSGQPTKGEPA